MSSSKKITTCEQGHIFIKNSNCLSCPVCEANNKPNDTFMSVLAGPARRALMNKGILTLEQLSQYTEEEVLALHGIGKSSIPKLQAELQKVHLDFRL